MIESNADSPALGAEEAAAEGTRTRKDHLRALAEYSATFASPGYHSPMQLRMFRYDGVQWPSIGEVAAGAEKALVEWMGESVAIDEKGSLDILFDTKAIVKPEDLWAGVLVIPPSFIDAASSGKGIMHTSSTGKDQAEAVKAALDYALSNLDVIYDCRKTRWIEYGRRSPVMPNTYGTWYRGPDMPEDESRAVCVNMVGEIIRAIRFDKAIRPPMMPTGLKRKPAKFDPIIEEICPQARDIISFYYENKDTRAYYQAEPECLDEDDREIYEKAMEVYREMTVALACITYDRGGAPLVESYDADVDAIVKEVRSAMESESVRENLRALRVGLVPFDDIMITFKSISKDRR